MRSGPECLVRACAAGKGVVDQLVQSHCIARRPPVMAFAAPDVRMEVVESLDTLWRKASEVREVLDFLRSQSNVLSQSQHVFLPMRQSP